MRQQTHNPEPPASLVVTRSVSVGAIGALFALAAFVIAIVSGLYSFNSAGTILGRGLLAMIACYPLGLVVGVVAQWVVMDQVVAFVESNPVPEFDDTQAKPDDDQEGAIEDGEEVFVV